MKGIQWLKIILVAVFALLLLSGIGIGIALSRSAAVEYSKPAADPIPVGAAFTYQGSLTDGGNPAHGMYDFWFRLYDAEEGGNPASDPVQIEDLNVINGRFTVELDFGPVFEGQALWLEIGVRPFDQTGDYTILEGRQRLTAAPYANYAIIAGHANSIADGSVTASKIGEPCAEGQVLARVNGFWTCADTPLYTAPPQNIAYSVVITGVSLPTNVAINLLELGVDSQIVTHTVGLVPVRSLGDSFPPDFNIVCLDFCANLNTWYRNSQIDMQTGGQPTYHDVTIRILGEGSVTLLRWDYSGCVPTRLKTVLSTNGEQLFLAYRITCMELLHFTP
jgi:hypothetical protein